IGGIIIVSTPQDLVKMIVSKAYNMAKMMSVPVLGLVENMSYYVCEDCGKKINIFGESKIDETAKELGVPVLAKLPVNPQINRLVDEGKISQIELCELDGLVDALKE
ncbi:MAG: P-loop NTPase, partial [Eubacterium sp.]